MPADPGDEPASEPSRATHEPQRRSRSLAVLDGLNLGGVNLVGAKPLAGPAPWPIAAPDSNAPAEAASPMARRLEAVASARRDAPSGPVADDTTSASIEPSRGAAQPDVGIELGVARADQRRGPDATRARRATAPSRPEQGGAAAAPQVMIGSIEVVTSGPRPQRPDSLAPLSDRRRGMRRRFGAR